MRMSDSLERLGRMVDEAFSETDAMPGAAKAPASARTSTPRTDYTERSATVLGGGISYQAIEDICWIYQNRDLTENLCRYSWRQARRNVLRQGSLSKEWTSHRGRHPVRLTRKGVEVKLADGVQTLSWKRIQNQVGARRS